MAHRVAGRPSRARLAVLNVASRVSLRALPQIPDARQAAAAGRADGHDRRQHPGHHAAVDARRCSGRRGVGGLVASDDIAVARVAAAQAGRDDGPRHRGRGHATSRYPDPRGRIAARHYTPVDDQGSARSSVPRTAAGLLPRRRLRRSATSKPTTDCAGCCAATRACTCCPSTTDSRPSTRRPRPSQDCYAAYRWALEHAAELGADPTRVAVGGDSAGGNLATVVSQLARDDGVQLPALQLLLYPVTQLRRRHTVEDAVRRRLLPDEGRTWTGSATTTCPGRPSTWADPRVSPLLADDLSGLPPALLADRRLRSASRRGQPVRRGAGRGGRRRRPPAVRLDGARLRQLLPAGGRQRHRDGGHRLGATRASEPHLRNAENAAGTLVPVATKPKKTASYDLKAADRRRNLLIQIGLTAVVVIFAVALVLYIVMSGDKKPTGGEAKAIRVASSKLITKEGTTEPKAVLSLYEDFLCPVCGRFEQQFGPTITQLIDSGAIAADYNMVAILDRPANQNYSSRAGGGGLLRGRRRHHPGQAGIPAIPLRAVRPAAQRDRDDVPHRRAADRDRTPGRCRRQGARLHQQRPQHRPGQRPRRGDERERHPDRADQRRGLPVLHARCAGRQDQGDRR